MIIAPLQALYQTLRCVYTLTLYFVINYWQVAKLEMFGRAWGPALVIFGTLVVMSAWNRLTEYDYIPLSITIATALAVVGALSKWWSSAQ